MNTSDSCSRFLDTECPSCHPTYSIKAVITPQYVTSKPIKKALTQGHTDHSVTLITYSFQFRSALRSSTLLELVFTASNLPLSAKKEHFPPVILNFDLWPWPRQSQGEPAWQRSSHLKVIILIHSRPTAYPDNKVVGKNAKQRQWHHGCGCGMSRLQCCSMLVDMSSGNLSIQAFPSHYWDPQVVPTLLWQTAKWPVSNIIHHLINLS